MTTLVSRHENSGACLKCARILNRYPNFHKGLRTWFERLQLEHPDAHVSDAGRGRIEQETFFERGASRAHWGESAHNYNAALDLFQLKDETALWHAAWFLSVVEPALTDDLRWYGKKGSEFYELPHIEVANFRELVKNGEVHLVE